MESKLRRQVDKYFSHIIAKRQFSPIEDSTWEAMMRGLGKKFTSRDFRVRFVLDRGTLSVYGTSLDEASDWFNLVNVISWIDGGRALLSFDQPLQFAAAFDRAYASLADFFGPSGLSAREKFLEWEVRRF